MYHYLFNSKSKIIQIVQYKCTNYYDKNSEICLNAFDANVGIQWPEGEKLLSEKDKEGLSLEELSDLFF